MVILWCNYNNFDTIQTHAALRALRALRHAECMIMLYYSLSSYLTFGIVSEALRSSEMNKKNDEN